MKTALARHLLSWLAAALAAVVPAAAGAQPRPLLIVTTDIGGDPDDMQSMRRLMLYSNEFEIVGLIASASGIVGEVGRDVVRPELIGEIVDDYAAVRETLALHAPGYPTADELRSVIRAGSPRRGVASLGSGRATEGSRQIIAAVDAADRPVHVAIWGGAHDLAQALWDVRVARAPAELDAFVARLRVYAIGDQDAPRTGGVEGIATGEWIRANFPGLRYVQSGVPGSSAYAASFRGMYQNDSAGGGSPTLPLVDEAVAPLVQMGWVEEHVRSGHGTLGAGYPLAGQNPTTPRNTRGVKEGDTPSWLFVLPTGLSDAGDPAQGGWGGRFAPASGEHFFDAEDEHWSGSPDVALRRKWTIARWREAYQNDFAARLDWSVQPHAAANHPPRPAVDRDTTRAVLTRRARAGDRVTFSARGSADPDGDRLTYRWWVYREASTYPGAVGIDSPDGVASTVHVPSDAAGTTIHLVLEVSDHGTPRLTRYRRVVVHVEPARPGR